MTDPTDLLAGATHVVLQDFPDPDVPEALVRVGLQVTVYGGPDPSDVSQLERRDDVVVAIDAGRRPDSADLLSVYRPPTEISGVVAEAVRLGVSAVWRQPAADEPADVSARWRSAVEAAGLEYLDSPPIAGVASGLAASRPPS